MPEQHSLALLLAIVAILGAMRPRRFGYRDPDLVWRRASLLQELRWRVAAITDLLRATGSQPGSKVAPAEPSHQGAR